MIITCPNCQTRYQVANDAIGSAGRKVQCANCQTAWQATPEFPRAAVQPRILASRSLSGGEDDRLFEAMDEAGLDAVFAAEERRLAAQAEATKAADWQEEINPVPPAKPKAARSDSRLTSKQQRDFSRRRDDLISSLPFAKVRRTLRLVGLTSLACLVAGGIYFRTDIVRQLPDLNGIYQSLGLGVNVIGLEFRDVNTLLALKDGHDVMMIDAKIESVSRRRVEVPQVVVTLLDANEEALYEWSVTPDVADLAPGEVVNFETQLASPPPTAERVKLTFINGRTQSDKPDATIAQPQAGAH
jgi:predicted Zn finger-like uncharacterized protein